MRRRHVNRVAMLVAAAGLTLGLAGCGDDGGDNGDATTTTEAAAGTTTAAPAVTTTAGAEATTTTPDDGADSAAPAVLTAEHADLGTILVDAEGFTLYTFDNDSGPTSSCTGGCASTWPPALTEASDPVAGPGVTGALGTSTHPSGGQQLTLDGMPLYRYSDDGAPGDANGDGVGGVWHVVPIA